MRVSTAHNHYRRLLSIQRDIFACGRAFSVTHDDMLRDLRARVREDAGLKRCPTWVGVKLSAWAEAEFDALYRSQAVDNSLVWVLYLDGERIKFEDCPSERMPDLSGRFEWSKTGKTF